MDGLCRGPQGLGCLPWTPEGGATHPTNYSAQTCYLLDLANNSGTRLMPAARWLNGTFSTALYAAEAARLVRRHGAAHRATPFYMYLAWHVVHMPLEAPAAALARQLAAVTNPNRRALMAMVTALDDGVAEVVGALKDAAMWPNTILVVTTDNGGATNSGKYFDAGNNWPLRGSKCTEWQGGVHGVAFVSGPRLPAAARNTTWRGMMHVVDWYPTVAKMAGLPAGALADTGPLAVDGLEMWSALQAGGPSPRTEMVLNMDGKDEKGAWAGSFRMGDLKLLVGFPGHPDGHVTPAGGGPGSSAKSPDAAICADCSALTADPATLACTAKPCLFNISADPEERTDLSAALPAELGRLRAAYEAHRSTAVAKTDAFGICPPAPPEGWPDACAANAVGGYWQPWADAAPEPDPEPWWAPLLTGRVGYIALFVAGLSALVLTVGCVAVGYARQRRVYLGVLRSAIAARERRASLAQQVATLLPLPPLLLLLPPPPLLLTRSHRAWRTARHCRRARPKRSRGHPRTRLAPSCGSRCSEPMIVCGHGTFERYKSWTCSISKYARI
jgi:hypothetical protein